MPLVADPSVTWSRGAVFHQYPRGNKMGKSVRVSAGYIDEHEWRLTIWLHWKVATDQQILWDGKGVSLSVTHYHSGCF